MSSRATGGASRTRAAFWLVATLAMVCPPAAAGQGGVVLTGVPTGTTNANPVIQVSAPAAVSYKYSINGSPYSGELPIQAPITFGADVRIGSRTFSAGTRDLFDFINRRVDELYSDPFLGTVSLEHVESQVQLTYLLNKIRTAVEPENILSIRGPGIGALDVILQEKVPVGTHYELDALSITGGELSRRPNLGSTRRFLLSLPGNAGPITLVPKAHSQSVVTVNGVSVTFGGSIVLPQPADGASISLQATGPDSSQANYQIDVAYDNGLEQTTYRSYYLRAFEPSSAYVSIRNGGPDVVSYGITFNQKFGLTRQGVIREIEAMAPEYSGEPLARKVWRFVRDNRYHFEALTGAAWFPSVALFFNSLGFGYCDDSAELFTRLMTAMGYSTRVWGLSGHVVPEVFVNGRWEMWDPDLEVYYHRADGLVAGVEELASNPSLITSPVNPVLDILAFPYQQTIADLYSSGDNAVMPLQPDPIGESPVTLEIPPGGAFEFPDLYETPLAGLFLTHVPSYANARLIVPAGFSGALSIPLVIHSIGWSNNPTIYVLTKDAAGNWDSQPTVASWIVDCAPPITVASQPAGSYNPGQLATLTTSEPATIYYTTDGTTPTEASSIYTAPFGIPAGAAVRFFAVDQTGNREQVRVYGPPVHQLQLQVSSHNSTSVTVSAQASGGVGPYEYLYWLRDLQSIWWIARPYSTTNAWTWAKTGLPPGTYEVQAWARNVGTTVSWDAWAGLYLVIPVTDAAPNLINPGDQTTPDSSISYPEAVAAAVPAGYWRLADTTGPTAADTAGSNPGAVIGGVTLGQTGVLADGNAAMLFNGSGYVRVPHSAAMALAGNLTIELWVHTSWATRQTLISKSYLHEFELTLETSGHLNFYQGNGSTWENVVSVAGAVNANTWQHVVVTREAATKTIRFYVNGVARGSGSYANAPASSANAISIGRSNGDFRYVTGRLDEVALYSTVLSAAQIETHYALRSYAGSGTPVALQLTASDADGDQLTYSATGLPASLTVNAATGLIAGTMSAADVGAYQVTASASDGSLSDSKTFTWTVTHVNRAPVLTNPGGQTSAENATISLPLSASDPDGSALTYTASGLPASVTIDATTGVISGTLSFASAGTYTVTASVSDGSLSDSRTFTWTVTNTNRAPVLASPGTQTTNDNDGYPQAVLADAPAGYWRLGESTGPSAADTAGSNPGAVIGGVTLGQIGALADGNAAMLFNGSGYVRVPDSAAMALAGNLTIELWVHTSWATRQTLISKSYLREFELTLETSGHLNFYQGNGSTWENVVSVAGAVSANTWQHVVVTREVATKTIRFYVNGVAKGSGSYTNAPASSGNAISIGRSDGGIRYVTGRLDEVALYSTALSAAQIDTHYARRSYGGSGNDGYPQAVLADAPAGYWRLGESAGPSAADSAGSNPGAVIGGVTLGQSGALADGNAAMLFNGSTGYVRIPTSATMSLAGDLTIELWINVPLATRQTLISKDYLHEFELTLETSGQLNLYQGNGTAFENVWSVAAAVVPNVWQHVVVTRSAATKTIRFYVNGVAKGSGSYVNTPTAGTRTVVIGRSDNYPGVRYVNGRLDDVAVYQTALSAAQIATHYALRAYDGSGTPVALQLLASDADGDALTYTASGLPPSLSVDAATGLVSGTLTAGSAGTYQVTITASDGSLSHSQTFTWTVTHN